MAEISIIVPVYNEAEHILPFYYELKKHTPKDIELIWVDDGSTDSTLAEIEQLTTLDSRIRCITLTRNFGQVAAISAGIDFALAPSVIIMSGDLKHPPSVIPQLISKMDEGFEIVNAISNSSAKTVWGQRQLLDFYYRMLNKIAPTRNDNDLTFFRAFNYKVSEGIRQVKERNLFLSDFFTWSGYKTTWLVYNCAKCSKNQERYSFKHLSKETITAVKHLGPGIFKSLFALGIVTFAASAYVLLKTAFTNGDFSLPVLIPSTVLFIGSLFLLIKSRYRLQKENNSSKTRATPKYLIKDIIEQDNNYFKMSYELLKQ
jgi:polyisoprenyl-phosphate glycosyltransferase